FDILNWSYLRFLFFGSAWSALLLTPRSVFPKDPVPTRTAHVTLDHVLETWQKRESGTLSVEFTWAQRCDSQPPWRSYEAAWLPEQGNTRRSPQNSLRLRGDRFRYETDRWYCPAFMEYSGFSASGRLDVAVENRDPFYRLYFHDALNDDFYR